MDTQIHTELEKHDQKVQEFIKKEFSTMRAGLLSDLKSLLFEQSKEIGKVLNEQDKSLALLKQDVENNKSEMRGYNQHNNKFKEETRDALKKLEYAGQRQTGATGLAKWLVTCGVFGGLVSFITLILFAYQVMKK